MHLRLSLLTLLLAAACCGCRKSEPTTSPPKQSTPPSESPAASHAEAPPAQAEAPQPEAPPSPSPPSIKPKVEPPRQKSGSADVRSLLARLAVKEGGKWQIDAEAQEQLAKLGPKAIDQVMPLLSDESADVRRGAAYHLLPLAASRDDLAEAYARLLDDSDATVRGIALSAMGQLKPAQKAAAAASIAQVLARTSDDEQQRAAAARLLGDLRQEAAGMLPQLSSTVANDPSPKVRSSALLAISRIAEPAAAVETFVKSLGDQDVGVRLMAVQRLRELGPQAAPAVQELAKLLDHRDERIRRTAGESLVRIGSKSVPLLTAALESDSRDAREIAVLALGSMGPLAKPALPALKKRLSDSDPKVKEMAKTVVLQLELP